MTPIFAGNTTKVPKLSQKIDYPAQNSLAVSLLREISRHSTEFPRAQSHRFFSSNALPSAGASHHSVSPDRVRPITFKDHRVRRFSPTSHFSAPPRREQVDPSSARGFELQSTRGFELPCRSAKSARGQWSSSQSENSTRSGSASRAHVPLPIRQYRAMKAKLLLPVHISACWSSSIEGPDIRGSWSPTIPRSMRNSPDH